MLTRTFCHIQGICGETERSLWMQGCRTWNDFLADPDRYEIGSAAREEVWKSLEKSQNALRNREHQYFAQTLGTAEAWRAWPDFKDSCLYLDIETDGGRFGHSVTVIGLYDGKEFRALIKGHDIDDFRNIISNCSMIVTFFGLGFDVPMLQKRFRDVIFDHIHLDLCATLRRIGYKGGLKSIEKQLGLSRADEADGLTGRDAIRLWREYQMGRMDSLDTLIAYNREDVVNMEFLANIAYEGLMKQVDVEPQLFLDESDEAMIRNAARRVLRRQQG